MKFTFALLYPVISFKKKYFLYFSLISTTTKGFRGICLISETIHFLRIAKSKWEQIAP